MAIVLDVSPLGSVASYTDLIAELRDLQDNASYDTDVIARAVRKAEAFFLRRLRVSDMELSTTLVVSGDTVALPVDLREIRSVVWYFNGYEYPLGNMSLSGLVGAYGTTTAANGGYVARPVAYAREGNTLRFAPATSGTLRLVYYADITPLTDAYPTNWLLQASPDLYIAGAQYYLCRRERDDMGAQMALAEANAIIDAMQTQAAFKAGGNLIPQGITQVGRIRA
jgi:hypothetical protein